MNPTPTRHIRVKTPADMLDHWAATRPREVYLRQPRGGVYLDFTWQEVRQQARQIAGALRQLGLVAGDRVALLSKNCAEWLVTDLALMLGGYVSVPIYPTANSATVRQVLEDSRAKAVFVGEAVLLQGTLSFFGRAPSLLPGLSAEKGECPLALSERHWG